MDRIIGILSVAMLLQACATTDTTTFASDPLIRPGAKIELGTVTESLGESYDIDAAALMTAALKEALSETDIEWQGDPNADRFLLDVVVDGYEPGNAFKRWLVPGYGSTIVHVSGKLTDLSTGKIAGELDHERAVHMGGAYTIGAWQNIFGEVAEDVVTELDNRINSKGFTVKLVPWPVRDIDIPVTETPQTWHIASMTDQREERGRIGERKAAFNTDMGSVYFYRLVPGFVSEAVASELLGAGHKIVTDGSGKPIKLELRKFWTHTDVTALYWDVIAEIEVGATVGEGAQHQAEFACETKKRTYVWPSLSLVTDVMDECLVELMADVRNASLWTVAD